LFVLHQVIVAVGEGVEEGIRLSRIRESEEVSCHETPQALNSERGVEVSAVGKDKLSGREELLERGIGHREGGVVAMAMAVSRGRDRGLRGATQLNGSPELLLLLLMSCQLRFVNRKIFNKFLETDEDDDEISRDTHHPPTNSRGEGRRGEGGEGREECDELCAVWYLEGSGVTKVLQVGLHIILYLAQELLLVQ
jgi:hypothetical protein